MVILHALLLCAAVVVTSSVTIEDLWQKINSIQNGGLGSSDHLGYSWNPADPEPTKKSINWKKRVKAPVDECYCSKSKSHDGSCSSKDTMTGCQNKTNEAYVWGMTRVSSTWSPNIFWGTIANFICLAPTGSVSQGIVCEGEGKDYRTPSVYMFSEVTKQTMNLAKQITGIHFTRLNNTLGLRAAGNRNGVVVLAGPSKSFSSVNMFAFDYDGKFLGSDEFQGYNDVRKFSQEVGADCKYCDMYVGLGRKGKTGHILRFKGSTYAEPLSFEIIAEVMGNPAEVSIYQDRLLVSTWPGGGDMIFNADSGIKNASLFLSRNPASEMHSTSTPSPDKDWVTVWSIDDYEPDRVTALSMGVSVSYEMDGWLYWGTMQVPYGGVGVFELFYGPATGKDSALMRVLGTHRPTALFRGRNLVPTSSSSSSSSSSDTYNPQIEVLYGEPSLPVYNQVTGWSMQANNMNQIPKFGHSGFGNIFNMYTWSMAAFKDNLLIGTFDNSYGNFHYSVAFEKASRSIATVGNIDDTLYDEANALFLDAIKPMRDKENANNAGPTFGADLFLIPALTSSSSSSSSSSTTATSGTTLTTTTTATSPADTIVAATTTTNANANADADADAESASGIAPALHRSENDIGPAEWVSLDGLGNELNYGLRNMLRDPLNKKDNIFMGTANSYNLEKLGGWEVFELDLNCNTADAETATAGGGGVGAKNSMKVTIDIDFSRLEDFDEKDVVVVLDDDDDDARFEHRLKMQANADEEVLGFLRAFGGGA